MTPASTKPAYIYPFLAIGKNTQISGLGASSNSGSRQADHFALQAANPFARDARPSAAADQAVDPFADLLQLSFSRESPGPAASALATAGFARYVWFWKTLSVDRNVWELDGQ